MKILCGILALLSLAGNMYDRPATVIDTYAETTVCESQDGHIWEFDGGNYAIGESVIMRMDDCGTDDITDDIIRAVNGENLGWTEKR